MKTFCTKCKTFTEIIKPIYVPINSNSFFCSQCLTKINISKKSVNQHD